MKKFGADYMATGHYAIIERSTQNAECSLFLLERGRDRVKDQSYFLYRLNQEQLSKILFPLGGLTKQEVRKIAKEIDLEVYDKADSLEVCFVKDNDYRRFLEERLSDIKSGDIINTKGEVLGKHKGITNYTIGQRRGLGITFGKPMFVVAIDAEKNVVVLGEQEELLTKEFLVEDVSFTNARTNKLTSEKLIELISNNKIGVKVRSQADIVSATIEVLENGNVKVIFEKAQRAVTPGQSAVFYDGDVVLGGGVIVK